MCDAAGRYAVPVGRYGHAVRGYVPENLANLAQVQPGVTKNPLYELIGLPHFHEWIFHVRTWNYLFQFRDAGKVATCQYQIPFDSDNRVVKTRWDKRECEAFGGKGAEGKEG
ncbi:flagellar motor protein MotB [Burkholderia lata]|uniref:Flagellar motor protein MotB n=1 Tax=Burkholderia lata (strain ATCC 17760 / DSM 23089 / LMG 22485 / NCIMB 9086 / R18194 / 383) TaxID=482957 RepID=A0A6P2ZYM4_BURL3|nr:flagellar motor protein MotB [Burkholderia lata]